MPSFAYKRRFATLARSRSHWTATSLLLFAALLLVGAAILLGLNLQTFRASFGWVQHTNNTLLKISRTETYMSRVEATTRGWILSGDKNYLARFQLDEKLLRETMASLKYQMRDNAQQQKNVDDLRRMVEMRLKVVHMLAAVGPSNPDKAGALLREPRFRNELFALRDVLNKLRGRETEYLAQRQKSADQTATLYFALAISTAIIAVLLVGLGAGLIQWERNRLRLRELQGRLYHVQRLSAVEATASALAHEINQPLAAASNYVGALRNLTQKSEPKISPEWSDIIANIGRQIERATGIIARLRNFASGQELERTYESPASIVEDAVALLGTLDPSLRMQVHIDPHLPDVFVDRIQIQQVLVNLMRNAIEATQETATPSLTLDALQVDGTKIEIVLRDNGPGLPAHIKEQLFQPFVTTKENGMGVGLSICRAIIEHHDGRIWVESLPKGTAFHFTLPVVQRRAAA